MKMKHKILTLYTSKVSLLLLMKVIIVISLAIVTIATFTIHEI